MEQGLGSARRCAAAGLMLSLAWMANRLFRPFDPTLPKSDRPESLTFTVPGPRGDLDTAVPLLLPPVLPAPTTSLARRGAGPAVLIRRRRASRQAWRCR